MVGWFYAIANKQDRVLSLAIGCVAVVLGCLIIDLVRDTITFTSIVTRRVFFVPAMLSNVYYEFFEGKFMLLSHSFLSPWFDNPVGMSPSMAVGQMYFGVQDLNANNGVVADGYMNFGIAGMLVWAILVGLAIALFSGLSEWVDGRIAFPLGLNAFNTFIDGGFFTGLLTHGVLFATLLILFSPTILARPTKNLRRGPKLPSGLG